MLPEKAMAAALHSGFSRILLGFQRPPGTIDARRRASRVTRSRGIDAWFFNGLAF